MRVLVHLSDLHFGRVTVGVAAPLMQAVHAVRPDLVVVSGDLVEYATRPEFVQAREFLERLPAPQLVVPGNHDMPFYNPLRRVLVGLKLYKEYIATDLEPFFKDGEVAVMGVNTARLVPIRGGRISEEQVRRVERRLCSVGGPLVKILVTHHPFDLDETYSRRELVRRAGQAMARFARSIDLMLAGHMHVSQTGSTALRYRLEGHSAIYVQAGAATSARGRGEPNAFNVIRIERPSVIVEQHRWLRSERRFVRFTAQQLTLEGRPACDFDTERAAIGSHAMGQAPTGDR